MKNVNQQAKLLIAGLSLIAMGLIIIMGYFILNNNRDIYLFNNKKPALVNQKTIPLDKVENIEINYRYENIHIYKTSAREITLNEYRNEEINENEKAKITSSNDTIRIEGQGEIKDSEHFFSFVAESDYVELYIPDSYHKQLKCYSSSGDQSVKDPLTLTKAFFETSSGYIDTKELKGTEVQFKADSGDIGIEGVLCSSLSIVTSSGYLDIGTISSNACTLRTSSGDIDADNILGEASMQTTSGYVDLGTVSGNTIELKTQSGDIEADIILGEAALQTTSGYVDLGTVSGNTIELETQSGDIEADEINANIELKTTSGYSKLSKSNGNIQFKSNSGDVTIHNKNGSIKGSTSSGYVKLSSLYGNIDVTTESGDIELTSGATTGSIRLNSQSGEQEIVLMSDISLSFDAVTQIGDIETFFDDELMYNKDGDVAQGTIGKLPRLELDLSTTSGDIEISEKNEPF